MKTTKTTQKPPLASATPAQRVKYVPRIKPRYRDVRDILAAVGGGARVAVELGLTRQGVSMWVLQNQVPLSQIAPLCKFLDAQDIYIDACMLNKDLAELKKFLCAQD